MPLTPRRFSRKIYYINTHFTRPEDGVGAILQLDKITGSQMC